MCSSPTENLGTAIFRVRGVVVILMEEIKEAAMGIESGDFSKSGSGQRLSAKRGKIKNGDCFNEAGWPGVKWVAAAAMNGSRQRRRVPAARLIDSVVIHPT